MRINHHTISINNIMSNNVIVSLVNLIAVHIFQIMLKPLLEFDDFVFYLRVARGVTMLARQYKRPITRL